MEGNSVALVLQAGMFGKWEPGLFQQLGACDRSCGPRKGVPSQEGAAGPPQLVVALGDTAVLGNGWAWCSQRAFPAPKIP